MKLSGFTIVKNAEKLGYPVVEAIKSALPLCDEFIVNFGDSDDNTEKLVKSIDYPNFKFIYTPWNPNNRKGGRELACQTNIALAQCTGDWGLYIQADECIHENSYDAVRQKLHDDLSDLKIDGYLSKYYHFWGDYDHLMPDSEEPYPHSIRIIRIGSALSCGDACGFRAIRKWRRCFSEYFRAKKIDMPVYHYGHVRLPKEMWKKNIEFKALYDHKQTRLDDISKKEYGETFIDPGKSPYIFNKSHPKIMDNRIKNFNKEMEKFKNKKPISSSVDN